MDEEEHPREYHSQQDGYERIAFHHSNEGIDLEQLQQEDALFPWLADGSMEEYEPE